GAAATDAATLNGINLQHGYAAGTTWPPITTDDDGNELSVQAVNENLYSFYEVLRKERDADGNATGNPETDISTLAKARTILEKIENALLAVSRYRATVGAHQSSLEGHVHQIDVAIDNYDASRSRIQDVDVAEESTRLAKYNILVQSSTAILAQANQIPQNVLRLLN
ncbi:MAG: flagellin, partial [Limisphaerales bacterium]